jgi:hypothetical protein
MASEPYERPLPAPPARLLNERQRLIGAPPEVGTGAHLTITEDGAARWGVPPPAGRSVLYPDIERSWNEPDVMMSLDSQSANGWAVGLTEDQIKTIMAIGGTYQQRVFLAEGYRQMAAQAAQPPGTLAKPRYVHPLDAANPDSAGLVTETLHEREVTEEEKQKRSRVPIPAESVSGEAPVAFTEVDALSSRVQPLDVVKRVRGPRGSRGPLRRFAGRSLDSKQ